MLNWYLQSGNESDVVSSTRIRLARNIKDYPFVNKYTINDAIKIIEKIENIVPNLGYGLRFIKLKDLDEVAYVRFASVYRQFKDVSTFMEELQKILKEK